MIESPEQWKAALLMRLERTPEVELGTADVKVAGYVAEMESDGIIEVDRDESDMITVRRSG